MKIMVFDVPAETGGVLSVLQDFYDEVRSFGDGSVRWIFVLGRPEFAPTENITVLRFPWIKKSWLHRLFFDTVIAPRLIRQYAVDRVFSLQNTLFPGVDVPQSLYVQQALPFSDHRYSFFRNPFFWTHQNLIGRMTQNAIKKAEKVIVQSEWMRRAICRRTGAPERKIHLLSPRVSARPECFFQPSADAFSTFFFPAGPFAYKNHRLILEACNLLKQRGVSRYTVLFTLNGMENRYSARLLRDAKKAGAPVDFIGALSRDEVFARYAASVLLFPSFIETFGLPLLEASACACPVLASNCPFSHEVLDGRPNSSFFDPSDASGLADLMEHTLKGTIRYAPPSTSTPKQPERGSEQSLVSILLA